MPLLTMLNHMLPLTPLLLTTSTLINDVNEFIVLSTLLHPSHRRPVAQILPSFIQVLAEKNTFYHVPLHLGTIASISACIYTSVTREASSWWWAALALEIGHFAFVPPAFRQIAVFQGENSKSGEEKLVSAMKGLYRVQWWRMWIVNVPCWACCWVPVLGVLGM
jgi:hypothetical protein